jgi:hypothetical protein
MKLQLPSSVLVHRAPTNNSVHKLKQLERLHMAKVRGIELRLC